MSDPALPAPVPGVPPPPPKLNTQHLWLTLLTPGAATALGMVVLTILAATNTGNLSESVLTTLCGFVGLVTIVAWIWFINTISQRFTGPSLILLILAYPILQAIVTFAVFFVGCFAVIAAE